MLKSQLELLREQRQHLEALERINAELDKRPGICGPLGWLRCEIDNVDLAIYRAQEAERADAQTIVT